MRPTHWLPDGHSHYVREAADMVRSRLFVNFDRRHAHIHVNRTQIDLTCSFLVKPMTPKAK